jgi:hypothetical protein
MSMTAMEGLFLLGFWAPPLAVIAGALLLLMPRSAAHRAPLNRPVAAAHR